MARKQAPSVELVTGSISHVTADAIAMEDGTSHPADVIIMATGFQASKMLWPMDIIGRGGRTIRGIWLAMTHEAYLGITVPGFPNLFLTYGPNTNLAHGGSIIFHTECQVRYITQALREMIENGYSTLEVRADVHDGYNKLVDEKCRNMVWAHPGVTSWYKNCPQPRYGYIAVAVAGLLEADAALCAGGITVPAALVTRQSSQVRKPVLFLPLIGLPWDKGSSSICVDGRANATSWPGKPTTPRTSKAARAGRYPEG